MPRTPRSAPFAILFLFICLAGTAHAGTLCGTVRDAATLRPVELAGIFLYQGGAYTGIHGASDSNGEFCIAQIPAGTYDVSVRVDDYQTAWLTEVVITEDPTSVEVFSGIPAELDAPWPNPAGSEVFFRYRLGRTAPVRLVVYDLRGRLVRGWEGEARVGESVLNWDFRDLTGRPVASGLYFLRMYVEDRVLTRPIARVR